jgi:hypothetical protein
MGTTTNGFVVARIPLAQLGSPSTIDVEWTNVADSDGMTHGRLVQEARDQAIWATHVDTNTLRVFTWPAGGGFSWRDIDVQQWSRNDYSSLTPPVPANDPAKRVAVNWLDSDSR